MSLELEMSAADALEGIEKIILGHAFDLAGDDWAEIERTYEDAYNYVSFSISTDPGERIPSVRVEFGVHDETQRHATGGFKAQWDREQGELVSVQAIVLEGAGYCAPGMFLTQLQELLHQVQNG